MNVVVFTILIAAVSTACIAPLALALAAWSWRAGARAAVVDAVAALPLVLPPTAVGFLLLELFARRGPLGWLHVLFTPAAVVIACGVMSFPLMFTAFRVALETTERRYFDLARTLGATPLRAFFRVTLPLAWRGLLSGVLLAYCRAIGEFGATILVAGNIPGRTQTIALAIYDRVQEGRDADAALLVVYVVLIAASLTAFSRIVIRRQSPLPARGERVAPQAPGEGRSLQDGAPHPPLRGTFSPRAGRRTLEVDIRLPLADFTLEARCTLAAQVTALVGRSGSGKTSLIESIAGLRNATGRIALDGVAIEHEPPERRGIGYVPQDAALFPHLSVRDNVRFGGRDEERFASLRDTLELGPLLERAPASLSGGERQRVALARALMTAPRLLLLDEPLASVDQPLRERILLFLRRVRDLGVPMIYVTHQPFEALALANDCVVLRDGAIIARGAPRDVLAAVTTEVDNVFEVANPRHEPERGITRVTTTDGLELVLPYDAVRDAAFPLVVRISGEEVVVFGERPTSISSRNLIEAEVTSMTEREGVVDLVAGTIRVRITRAAADDLGLRAGSRVWLALRSRSFRVVG
jgi:molybdate transport system permease protein